MVRCSLAWLTLLLLLASADFAADSPPRAPTPAELDFFEKHIRPVFVEHCHACHGPEKQKSGLRLDAREAALAGGENGTAFIPGKPDESRLLQAVRQTGELKMPPKAKLKSEQVDALATWIKMGAPWPNTIEKRGTGNGEQKHWAFQPAIRPAVPEVKTTAWPQTPIDRFILTRLEASGLTPALPADKGTLIRRATFDLIGLPPTPEEVEAFVRDAAPDAFDRVIGRLLASPHYGERWGRHWLDVARYADTKGYVFFEEKEYPWAYTYRDYVIRSFNEDLPYDQFILEQLAADLLLRAGERASGRVGEETSAVADSPARPFSSSPAALPALGFLTLGGRFMNNMHDILDDRIDVVTRGLMGLTVTCARCHDHKFDPIPSRDYYALYGVFANSVEPTVPPLFFEPARTPEYEKFEMELKERERKYTAFVAARHRDVTRGSMTRVAEYLLATHELRNQPRSDDFMLISDPNDLNPAMVLRWKAYLDRTRRGHHPVLTPWHALAALPEQEFAGRAPDILTGFRKPDPSRPVNPLILRALAEPPPKTLADTALRYANLLNRVENEARNRVALPALMRLFGANPPEVLDPPRDPAIDELREVFHGPDSPPSWPLHTIDDLNLFPDRAGQGKLQEFRKAVEEWRMKGPGAPPRAMTLEDAPRPQEQRIFLRGNPNNLGDPAPRQFLSVVSGEKRTPFRDGSGRLELAQAIVDPRNPLTARVLVNRLWLHHFGQGLVRTPGDFGLRSDPPTHPELLDWLASEFIASGWSIKHMHRLIMRSAVYQQAAIGLWDGLAIRPTERVDPVNRLLSHMNRRRLDFETTRDALLAVSGRLDRTVGGPSQRDLLGAQSNRRTVYAFLDRLNVPGLFRTFDFPSPDATSPQRDTTTVAPQALFMMNNPFVLDCAHRLLQRPEIVAERDVAKRVDLIHRLLYGRPVSERELRLAQDFVGEKLGAAWEHYVQALLLANEFVFVD